MLKNCTDKNEIFFPKFAVEGANGIDAVLDRLHNLMRAPKKRAKIVVDFFFKFHGDGNCHRLPRLWEQMRE